MHYAFEATPIEQGICNETYFQMKQNIQRGKSRMLLIHWNWLDHEKQAFNSIADQDVELQYMLKTLHPNMDDGDQVHPQELYQWLFWFLGYSRLYYY